MAKANNKFFTQRGERDVTIIVRDEKIDIRVVVPTNKQHDDMMGDYTNVTPEGIVDVRSGDLLEDRLSKYIVSLPFDVPYNNEMTKEGQWKDATDKQKITALNMMDPKLRDKINDAISGEEEVSNDEVGNSESRSSREM